jgi:hypothetical protein
VADWKWFAGQPSGRSPHCSQPLFRADILVEWRNSVYHVHCLLDRLTALAPPIYNPYSS